MPRIPTYTASDAPSANPLSPQASAAAFNSTAGLENLAGGIQQAGNLAATFAAKKAADVGETYSASGLRQFEENSAKKIRDAENKGSVTIAEDYKTWADQELATLQKNAPNKLAEKAIAQRGMNAAASFYSSALRLGSANFVKQSTFEVEQSTVSMANAFRSLVGIDPVGASINLEFAYNDELESIDKRFKDFAPSIASERKATLTNDIALAAADHDTALARKIVEDSPDLGEPVKQRLFKHFDEIEKSQNKLSTFATELALESSIADAMRNLQPVTLSENFLKELPQTKQDALRFKADYTNQAVIDYSAIKQLNFQEQRAYLASKDPTGKPVQAEANEIVAKLIKDSEKRQKEDPAGWLRSNNDEIGTASRYLDAVPDAEKPQQRAWILRRSLELQGYPPEGTPENERGRYLNLPTGMRKVLDDASANHFADLLNNSTPNTLDANLQQFDASFGDPELAAHAYQDLVSHPGNKLKMGIRVGNTIIDPNIRANFYGAMNQAEGVKALNEKTYQEMEQLLDAHPHFIALKESWAGDNFQRSGQLKEFKDSILTYAAALKGDVNMAIKRVISDNYGVINQTGMSLAIHRKKSDGTLWTDDEFESVTSGMSKALANFNTDLIKMDVARFPAITSFAKDGVATGEQAKDIVKSAIRDAGVFVPEPDGETVTLYLNPKDYQEGAKGKENRSLNIPFQVLGKDGNPIKFKLQDFITSNLLIRRSMTTPETKNLIFENPNIDPKNIPKVLELQNQFK